MWMSTSPPNVELSFNITEGKLDTYTGRLAQGPAHPPLAAGELPAGGEEEGDRELEALCLEHTHTHTHTHSEVHACSHVP